MKSVQYIRGMTPVLLPRSEEETKILLDAIERAGKKVNKSKASARRFLIKHGYITASGKLTKRYRS